MPQAPHAGLRFRGSAELLACYSVVGLLGSLPRTQAALAAAAQMRHTHGTTGWHFQNQVDPDRLRFCSSRFFLAAAASWLDTAIPSVFL